MIWVLLEITLPLFLAFLFGLGAGWLFWRWRRRSITQSEWDEHGKMSATDALKFSSLQEEIGVYQRRAVQLEATTQQHFSEMNEAEKRAEKLSADLKTANDKLADLGSDNAQATNTIQLIPPKDDEALQQAAALEKQQANKIQELEFRSNNLQNTADQQSNQLQQYERDIKKLKTDLKSANDQLAMKEPNVGAEQLQKLEENCQALEESNQKLEEEITQVKAEKAQTEKQLEKSAADVKVHSNTATNLKDYVGNLEGTIERQSDDILEEKKKAKQLTDELETLRAQLSTQNDADNNLDELQTRLDSETAQKSELEAKLKELSTEVSRKQDSVNELQSSMEKLEITVKKQSSELEDADKKQKLMADELKAATDRLEKQSQTNAEELGVQQSQLKVTTREKNQLAQELQTVSSYAEQQTSLSNELQQKLKQSETAVSERDTAIEKIKQLETELSAVSLKNRKSNSELEQSNTRLENLTQKFRNMQSSAVANRQSREEQVNKLRAHIEQLKSSLDQQRSKIETFAAEKQKIQELESQLAQASKAASELNQAKATIESLNIELGKVKSQQSMDATRELSDARRKLDEVTTQLNQAKARNEKLAASIEGTTPTAVTPISVGQIKKLKKEVEQKEQRIAELEKKLKAKSQTSNAKKVKPTWQKGETKIGTPGSDHKDDLKAINGIGPSIEKVLNRIGIKSWEQLASLKVADIKRVDEALTDFPGRIVRDEWVAQAKAIMKNGHQPLDKNTKRATAKPVSIAKRKPKKTSWQQGETRFGTPGSVHRDDLKVINGIGPVIEKTLNRYGIKSWEQLASLKVKDVKTIDEKLNFPGRINREQWVSQAKALIKKFPDHSSRPTRRTFLNQAAGAR